MEYRRPGVCAGSGTSSVCGQGAEGCPFSGPAFGLLATRAGARPGAPAGAEARSFVVGRAAPDALAIVLEGEGETIGGDRARCAHGLGGDSRASRRREEDVGV